MSKHKNVSGSKGEEAMYALVETSQDRWKYEKSRLLKLGECRNFYLRSENFNIVVEGW